MHSKDTRQRLIWHGMLLFLFGLLTGLTLPILTIPRLGLSAHLEALMSGMFLMILGLIWSQVKLRPRAKTVTFWLALYAAYVNWGSVLLAGLLGAGRMLPIAAAGHPPATAWKEGLVGFGLITLSVAIVVCCTLVLWGLSKEASEASA